MTARSLHLRANTPLFASPMPIVSAALATSMAVGVLLAVRPTVGLGLFAAALLVPLALLNLPAGIVVWTVLVFVELLTVAPTLIAFLLALAWLGGLTVQSASAADAIRRSKAFLVPLGMLVAWNTLSLIWARDTDAVLSTLWFWYLIGAMVLVLVSSIGRRRYLAALCVAFVFGAVLSVVGGLIFDPGTTVDTVDAGRYGGTAGDANYLAAGLVPAMALIIGLANLSARPTHRWLAVGGLLVLAAGLGATGSRGGLVAAVVAVLVSIVTARTGRLRLSAVIAIGAIILSAWVATTSPATWNRVRDFNDGSGRTDLWTVATRMAEDNATLGVGSNNFETVAPQYTIRPGLTQSSYVLDTPHVVHNVYLQQFSETGAIGLALLLATIGGALTATWRAAARLQLLGDERFARLARAILVAQLSMLSASLFISNVLDKRFWILLSLGPILLTIAVRRTTDRREQPA